MTIDTRIRRAVYWLALAINAVAIVALLVMRNYSRAGLQSLALIVVVCVEEWIGRRLAHADVELETARAEQQHAGVMFAQLKEMAASSQATSEAMRAAIEQRARPPALEKEDVH